MSCNPTPYGEVPPTPDADAALDVKDPHEHHWFIDPTEPVGAKFTLWLVIAQLVFFIALLGPAIVGIAIKVQSIVPRQSGAPPWPSPLASVRRRRSYGSSSRPVRELKGFRRIQLAAGASQTVEFSIGPDERRYWSAAAKDFVNEASTFDVWVGGDSTAKLTINFTTTS